MPLLPAPQVSAPNITLGTIATAFPFDSQLVDIQLTGNELWNVFEGVASKVNVRGKTVTSTVQVSGIRYEFNPKNKKGSRLISLRVGPDLAEVDMERTYKVVTLDFMCVARRPSSSAVPFVKPPRADICAPASPAAQRAATPSCRTPTRSPLPASRARPTSSRTTSGTTRLWPSSSTAASRSRT